MLFCWLAASVAIQSILLPVDLGLFWILHYVIESYQRPKMGKLYSYTSLFIFQKRCKSLSCHIFLTSYLEHWATWQANSKSPPAREAARQKLSVLSSTKTSLLLTWVFLWILSQYSCFFFRERLDLAVVPTWILVLFLTFAFLSGWRSGRIYKQRCRMRWRERIAQGSHIAAVYEKAALTKIRFKEETIVKLKELFSLQYFLPQRLWPWPGWVIAVGVAMYKPG